MSVKIVSVVFLWVIIVLSDIVCCFRTSIMFLILTDSNCSVILH